MRETAFEYAFVIDQVGGEVADPGANAEETDSQAGADPSR